MNAEARDPNSDAYVCTCCGATDFTLRHRWEVGSYWNQCAIPLSVWDCKQCQLTVLYPIPEPHEYPGGGDWFAAERNDLSRKYWFKTFKRKVINKLIGTNSERFLKGCVKAKPTGKFLDVGCGIGEMLDLASNDYTECSGVEPSPIAAEEARKKGFTIYEDFFEDVTLPEAHYDVILMHSVIEHVKDPVAILRKCHKALAPDGVVAMLTPKLGGPAYRIHGEGWNGFRHGYHTFLFTGKTLGNCMEKAGFEVLKSPRRDRATDDLLILWGRKR